MLSWAVTFVILALVAALLGFGGVAGFASGIARVLFFLFLIGIVVTGLAHALRGRIP